MNFDNNEKTKKNKIDSKSDEMFENAKKKTNWCRKETVMRSGYNWH